jgi:hypothetical protein
MTYDETTINIGGLMRCCIATISEFVRDHGSEPAARIILDCKYDTPGNQQIILDGMTWRWHRERAVADGLLPTQ